MNMVSNKELLKNKPRTGLLTAVLAASLGFVSIGLAAPSVEGESEVAIEEGVPGGVITNAVKVTAEVVAVDHFNRNATLLRPDGETVTVNVGPEAVNFHKVEVGDTVNVTFVEELVVHLDDGSNSIGGSAEVMAFGAQSGGLVAEIREVVATISELDHEQRTATLTFQDGSTKTFPVRDDIDMSRHQPGEQVVFRLTEMVAIEIDVVEP